MKNKNKPLVIANWKMNLSKNDVVDFTKKLSKYSDFSTEVVICPPYIFLDYMINNASFRFKIGSQNCTYHENNFGPFTGEISAHMLKDLGCEYVIVGHYERRQYHHDHDDIIALKLKNIYKTGMKAILCLSESKNDKENNQGKLKILEQLNALSDIINPDNTIIAYEPVWAIGTGVNATFEEIKEMHSYINKLLKEKFKGFENKIKMIYGGSVNQNNAKDIMSIENVEGVLVGGASLVFDNFYQIIK